MTKEVYLGVLGVDYPLSEYAKCTYQGVVIDGYETEKLIGQERNEILIGSILENLPHLKGYFGRYSWVRVERYNGFLEEFKQDAKDYANYLIPILKRSGGDDTHYDKLPTAVESFIMFCQQFGDLTEVQRIYDSLWDPNHAYFPPNDHDPSLYMNFQKLNLNFHQDHP